MNKRMILRMMFDKKVIKTLWKYNKMLSKDKNYTMIKGFKMAKEIIKGEKIVYHDGKYIICTFMPPFPSEAFDNHINAVADKEKIFSEQIYSKRTAPISFHVALTHKCMYKCIYCSARDRSLEKELNTDQWKKVLKEMQDIGTSVIGLTGGEPLLRKDVLDIIESVDKRSSVMMFTTGKGLSFQCAKELKDRGLFGVGISLDTINKEKHDSIRGYEGAYDVAIEGIKNSVNAGLYTMIQTVILEKDLNKESLYEIFELARELKVNEVKILEPIMSGELMKDDINEGVFYTEKSRRRLIEIGEEANRAKKYPKITTFSYVESKERYGCGAGTQHSYISADGELYPCDFIKLSFGNVKEESIRELWKDMNRSIGIPKRGCFAMRINPKLKRETGDLIVDKEKSKEICRKYQGEEYPDFYKTLQ